MKLVDLVDYLDELFQVSFYGDLDTSFSSRMHIFPTNVVSAMEPLFLKRFNGLLLKSAESVDRIIASCFLCDDLIDEIKSSGIQNALLICHHMLDIDAGQPGKWNAKGFTSISKEALEYLQANGISVYTIHLPLDANASLINTHLALCNALEVRPCKDLLIRKDFSLGYLANDTPHWLNLAQSRFTSVLTLGDTMKIKSQSTGLLAVLAGMVSSVEMLEEIVNSGCTCLVCGDVLIRQKTERALAINKWLSTAPIPIVCLSHKETEEIALYELLNKLNIIFPSLPTRFLRGGSQWK